MNDIDKPIVRYPVVLVCPFCKRPIDHYACPCGKNRLDGAKLVRH